jgi:hypothetical protein
VAVFARPPVRDTGRRGGRGRGRVQAPLGAGPVVRDRHSCHG